MFNKGLNNVKELKRLDRLEILQEAELVLAEASTNLSLSLNALNQLPPGDRIVRGDPNTLLNSYIAPTCPLTRYTPSILLNISNRSSLGLFLPRIPPYFQNKMFPVRVSRCLLVLAIRYKILGVYQYPQVNLVYS